MAIRTTSHVYDGPGGPFEGTIAWDDAAIGPRPGVMVVPNVLGQKALDDDKAAALAALGYVGFVCDLYGQGKRTTRESPDPAMYMTPLDTDRALLRDRLHASAAAMQAVPRVDASRCAAIGYCFGGKAVIDLARSGTGLRGVVSFHGIFDPPGYAYPTPIAARLLICHGWDDPLAPPDSVVALGEELTAAGARWELHAYSGTGHAFTDPTGLDKPGFGYRADADRRSWAAAIGFLGEVLG